MEAATSMGHMIKIHTCIIQQRKGKGKIKLKQILGRAASLLTFALIAWLAVSFVDVLMHNDPIYGDKQYMTGNAIVMMTELAE